MQKGLSVYVAAATLAASVSLVVSAQQGPPSAAPIRLRAATFTPARGEQPDIPRGLAIAGYAAGQRGYFIVQFPGPVMDAWKAQVAAAGAELLDYIPDFAFKVRMTPEAADRVAALDSVAWVGLFQPAYKLDPALFRAGAATRAYRVRIERGADVAATVDAIAGAGVQIVGRGGNAVEIIAAPGRLNAIAHVLDVAEIEAFVLRKKNNEFGGGRIIGSGAANSHGFDGSSQTVAVADTGFGNGSVSNGFFDVPSSRVTDIYNWPGAGGGCFSSVINDGAVDVDSGHGTHTTTSVLGAGGPGGEGRGTAPAAHLVFQAIENWANISAICKAFYGYPDGYYLTGLPSDLHQLFQQAYDADARVHSNSWGSDAAGAYTTDSRNADDFIWNHRDMTITFSAGNAGIDANGDGVIDAGSIGAPATAKNVISVGASENDRQGHYECDGTLTYTSCAAQGSFNTIFTYGAAWPADYPANPIKDDPSAGNANQMAAFSSRGPASDGRIKPDVVAPGTWVLSGYSDNFQQQYDTSTNPQDHAYQYDGWGFPLNQYYKYMGGTSMSNPLVAGGAAVVRDFYYKTYGGMNASAALVKATIINSAVDLPDENNDGVNDNANPIPNRHEGWGRVDLNSATNGRRQFVDGAASLTTGANATYTYTIAAGSPFKVTLAWSDPASTTSAAKNLVNDLDLAVFPPVGTQYLGNVFAGGWSQTGGTADHVNNLENVYVASAAAGTWTVVVRGYNVPSGPQPFALVVDGAFGTPPPPAAPSTPDGLSASAVSATRIDLHWTDSTGEDQFDVERCDGAGCSFVKIGESPSNVVTYTDTSVSPSTTYLYRVRAVNTIGASGYSNTATVTTPAPPQQLHIGDLDSSRVASKNTWTASVTITIHDASHAAATGATVSGSWSGGFAGSVSCTAPCTVTTGNLNKSKTSVTFTVANVTRSGDTYASSSNHDSEGDSNGTSITILKP
jgi:subtilase family protein/fibronectin type III domain protein